MGLLGPWGPGTVGCRDCREAGTIGMGGNLGFSLYGFMNSSLLFQRNISTDPHILPESHMSPST